VTRPVDVTTAGATDLVITRSFDAPRRHVFAALTTPDLVRQWLGPPEWQMTTCAIDLRVGGRYRYEFAGPRGVTMGFGGVFTEIVASERIVSSEAFDDAPPGSDTVNTLLLTERNGVTDVVVTTDLAITGKPAQFGRGVMAEVGNKLIGQFADCLSHEFSGGVEASTEADLTAATSTPADPARTEDVLPTAALKVEPARPAPSAERPVYRAHSDAINLLDVAGAPVAKRLAPVAAGLAALALLVWIVRRRTS